MRKVEVVLTIQSSAEAVIEAFLDGEQLKKWWGVERALLERRNGGIYAVAWQISANGFGYVSTGTVKEYDPAGLLILDNFMYLNPGRPFLGPMRLTVRAEAGHSGTTCYLCQEGYGEGPDWDWYYDAVKEAWPVVMQALKKFLEGTAG